MTLSETLALLESVGDHRGRAYWAQRPIPGYTTFGAGLTNIRKVAKKVPKSHELAEELWKTMNYDALLLAILIDDPKQLVRADVEHRIANVPMLVAVPHYCNELVARHPDAQQWANEWMASPNEALQTAGWYTLGGLAANDKKRPDAFFLPYIQQVQDTLQTQPNWTREAMNGLLYYAGRRSPALAKRCIEAAKAIGPIHVDYGDNSCRPIDIPKNLARYAAKG